MNPSADRVWAAVALAAVLALGAAAVAGWQRAPAPTALIAAAAADPAMAAPAGLEVELSEFAIGPEELEAPAGTPIELTVANLGTIAHDVTLDDGTTTGEIAGSADGVLSLPPMGPGSFRLFCSIPGHADSGMEATLVVSEDAAPVEAVAVATDGDEHSDHAAMTPEEMVAGHQDGIDAFPADTGALGGQPLEPFVAADGTKELTLTAEEVPWTTAPGEEHTAYAYNRQVPGPRIDLELGDRVRIELRNELPDPTALHLHGLLLPNAMDGVPGLTQEPVMPGESFTYEFTVRNAGTHMYHSHFDSATQVGKGLLGALVVHHPADPPVDADHVMVVGDGPLGFTINGKGFPATQPIVAQLGQTIRIRYMNEGLQLHPMHLHGIPQLVVARDGYPLEQPYTVDTVTVAPGERIDVLIEATEPGVWAWHCHILNHAEGPEGMFGMVTALVVEA